jgi:hypothetical protein
MTAEFHLLDYYITSFALGLLPLETRRENIPSSLPKLIAEEKKKLHAPAKIVVDKILESFIIKEDECIDKSIRSTLHNDIFNLLQLDGLTPDLRQTIRKAARHLTSPGKEVQIYEDYLSVLLSCWQQIIVSDQQKQTPAIIRFSELISQLMPTDLPKNAGEHRRLQQLLFGLLPEEQHELEIQSRMLFKKLPPHVATLHNKEEYLLAARDRCMSERSDYNPSKGGYFSFIKMRFYYGMLSYLQDNELIKYSSNFWQDFKKINECRELLYQQGLDNSDQAIADKLDWSIKKVQKIMNLKLQQQTATASSDDTEGYDELSVLPDQSPIPEDIVINKQLEERHLQCILQLDERDRLMYIQRVFDEKTFDEIAQNMGNSPKTGKPYQPASIKYICEQAEQKIILSLKIQ